VLFRSGKVKRKIKEARFLIQSQDIEGALSNLIEAVVVDKEYCEELPRKAVIAIFNLLGPAHELTQRYRRQFDMALY